MLNITETTEIDIKIWCMLVERLLTEETQWHPALFPTIMVILFVGSLVGNLLTCIVIYSDKTMHTATNLYLFNLAISDLLVTFGITLEIYEHVDPNFELNYSFGEITCKIHFFLVVSLWNNGILIMTALAVERYVAICHPMMMKKTPVWRRVMKVLVIIWIVAIAETLPEIWTVRLVQTQKGSVCFIVPTPFAKIVNGVLAVVTFLVPLGIMMFVYSMIAFQMKVMQKSTSKGRIFNHRNNTKKVNKLIIALTVSFLVCWVPFFTIRILIFAWDAKKLVEVDQWWTLMYKITLINNWFSAVLNPLLFSVMSTKFRQALKTLWDKKVRNRQHRLEENTDRKTTHV